MQNKLIKRALISVSDKTGVVELAHQLVARGVEIISSDGTAALLRQSNIPVRTVTEITGSPEILGGKVKTLHPAIHGALLADQNDPAQLQELSLLPPIDLLVINLYPVSGFDIGGPALTRAAAKNSAHVAVITDPKQYPELIAALDLGTTAKQRELWAFAALMKTAEYDFALLKERGAQLRYGENPHQAGVLIAKQQDEILQGKSMSFNNYLDLDAAWKAAITCQDSVAIVKHGIASGIAQINDEADSATAAFLAAWSCDPISAFGGVVASTREVDESFASEIVKNFVEVVAAPAFTAAALETLNTKPNLRVVKLSNGNSEPMELRSIRNGYLMQDADVINHAEDLFENWRLVSGPSADEDTARNLQFAWRAAATARSNAVVIVNELKSIGMGAGSVSRIDAAQLAIRKAQQFSSDYLLGSVAASDAFFPFPDGVEALISAGVKAIVQPGGSLKDEAVIKAAQTAGITMYLTGMRHFSH